MTPNTGRRPCICPPQSENCECDPIVQVVWGNGQRARYTYPASKLSWKRGRGDFDIAEWEPAG